MLKIGVLVSGSGTNLQAIIDAIKQNNIIAEIVVVISDKKNAFGLQRAINENIPAIFISKKQAGSIENFNTEIVNTLKDHLVDLVVLAGYLSILSHHFISTYRNRIINIHPSLIPSFCGNGFYGIKVHEAAIKQGVKISGATVHFVDEGTDTGAIILQKAVEVLPLDTAETLQQRILKLEHELLPLAVKLFCENRLQIIEIENTITKVLVIQNELLSCRT